MSTCMGSQQLTLVDVVGISLLSRDMVFRNIKNIEIVLNGDNRTNIILDLYYYSSYMKLGAQARLNGRLDDRQRMVLKLKQSSITQIQYIFRYIVGLYTL